MVMTQKHPAIHIEPAASAEVTKGPYHGGELPAETAAAINNSVNIVVYGYDHGRDDRPSSPLAFDSARMIVDSLDPTRGDVLFTEIVGHDGAYPGTDGEPLSPGFLEALREARSVRPATYMVHLARSRGIPVIAADMDSQALQEFGRMARSQDPIADAGRWGWMYGPAFHTQREEEAASVVTDYAVEALPALTARAAQGLERPTYALAYGADHLNGVYNGEGTSIGIGPAFARMGLEAELREAPSDRNQHRLGAIATPSPDITGDFV
jgi:hypothetical protein